MSAPEIDTLIDDLRARSVKDSVFWTERGELAVFCPAAAQKANAANYQDMTLPDRLVDVLRGRESTPVSWKEVRAAWAPQMRRISGKEGVARLADRMTEMLDARVGRRVDFVWAAQEVVTRSLLRSVIDGLSVADESRIWRDQTMKLQRLMLLKAEPRTLGKIAKDARMIWAQIGSGLVARRELAGRATGRRPRRIDLAEPLVEMLPVLGIDRAAYAVTTVLTAIAGPPGAVAACLLFEIARRPEWEDRLRHEHAALSDDDFFAAPTRSAPLTHRFVKETLRLWSSPAALVRVARTPLEVAGIHLEQGTPFHMSPFILHRDPKYWRDPESFEPDGSLEEVDHGGRYVPFGWAPTACIGAQLGTTQLMVLARLACARYRVAPIRIEEARILHSAVPLPVGFEGSFERR